MRIIAGELKGRQVTLPKGSKARPTTGFVREMAMNLFTDQRLNGGTFIDICAASGVTGFEALSRGAAFCAFVEINSRHAGTIRETANQFGVWERVRVIKCDARRCHAPLAKLLPDIPPITAVFIDPPYIKGMALDLLPMLEKLSPLLSPTALIIIRSIDRLAGDIPGVRLIDDRKAGNARLWVYEPHHGEAG